MHKVKNSQSNEGLFSNFLQKRRLKKILQFLPRKFENFELLDYGCGDGALIEYINKKKINYFGFDIDTDLINENINNYNKKKYKFGTELPNKKFDIIVLSAVIEHLPNPTKVISELKNLLKNNNSYLIITTPNKYFRLIHHIGAILGIFSKEADEEHNIMFSKKTLTRLAQDTKLKMTNFSYFLLLANQIAIFKK